jgi:demethylmenaquinone methyltransferase / 2-methoxy-6-polyprenyl-1,4-benzoquinol methylase
MSYNKQQPESIQSMFGSIAKSYDRTNAILSFQLHRLWNRKLIQATASKNRGASQTIADLCCGTGAISLPWLASEKTPQTAYLIDFCQEMLDCAKAKASSFDLAPRHTLSYINADVQELPLGSESIDCATMAYGIRNVESPLRCFHEVYRVLKPGGTFGILELTEPKNPILRFGHTLYLKTALPLLGKIFANNHEAYKYLSRSIRAFVKPAELKALLEQAGFAKANVMIQPLCGGIATLITAHK